MTLQPVSSGFEEKRVIEQEPEMPGYAHFAFHWAGLNQQTLPEPLEKRAELVFNKQWAKCKTSDDAEDWILLSEAMMICGYPKEAISYLKDAQESNIPETFSEEETNRLTLQVIRQQASLSIVTSFLDDDNYEKAHEAINVLFHDPEGGTWKDLMLRAALEIHEAHRTRENAEEAVQHYVAAIDDLESAMPMDPIVIGAYLKLVRKKLVKTATVLMGEQVFASDVLERIYGREAEVLRSAIVQVDLALDFGVDHEPVSVSLSALASKVRDCFNERLLTIHRLERGPSVPAFLIYKVTQASSHSGVFTSQTKMTLIPGQEILSRSQNSLLYAINCHGTLGQVWAKRLDKGVCFGGAATWLIRTMKGKGQDYFDQLDKAVRHRWDDGVKKLFRDIMVFQFGPQRGLKRWHAHTGLEHWQSSIFPPFNTELFTQYITQLSQHTVGFLCACGKGDESHAVAGVLNPLDENGIKTGTFALFYDFNEEKGDLVVTNTDDLAKEFLWALHNFEGPITIQVYGLASTNPPPLIPVSKWIKEIGPVREELRHSILEWAADLEDVDLFTAWEKAEIEPPITDASTFIEKFHSALDELKSAALEFF